MKYLYLLFVICIISCENSSPSKNKITAPENGLIAFYPFNNNIHDESGNGLHGIQMSNVMPTTDRFDNQSSAFFFIGDNSYIKLIDTDLFFSFGEIDVTKEFSYSLWIYPYNLDEINNIFNNSESDQNNYLIKLKNNLLAAIHYDGMYVHIEANDVIDSVNYWYNITITASINSNLFCMYLNGELIESTEIDESEFEEEGDYLVLGAFLDGVFPEDEFYGIIDDVRLYNRELSAEEVIMIFNTTE